MAATQRPGPRHPGSRRTSPSEPRRGQHAQRQHHHRVEAADRAGDVHERHDVHQPRVGQRNLAAARQQRRVPADVQHRAERQDDEGQERQQPQSRAQARSRCRLPRPRQAQRTQRGQRQHREPGEHLMLGQGGGEALACSCGPLAPQRMELLRRDEGEQIRRQRAALRRVGHHEA